MQTQGKFEKWARLLIAESGTHPMTNAQGDLIFTARLVDNLVASGAVASLHSWYAAEIAHPNSDPQTEMFLEEALWPGTCPYYPDLELEGV